MPMRDFCDWAQKKEKKSKEKEKAKRIKMFLHDYKRVFYAGDVKVIWCNFLGDR